jgi:cell division protein FtsW
MNIGRTDTSLLGRWWWTVDRWTLAALVFITAVGAVLTLAASPPAAERIGLDTYHFARRQFVFLPMALTVMLVASLLSIRGVRRLSAIVFVTSAILMVAVLMFGTEIKGATRWLQVGPIALQPSEFIKPAFAVLSAWMFAEHRLDERFPGYLVATGLYLFVASLLVMQPDVGTTILISAIWAIQFFVAGLPLAWVGLIGAGFLGAGFAAYFTFAHVQARVDRFFDPSAGEGYQVTRGLEAFRNGGFFGRGPGEGEIKAILPDAHTDFIFSVAGEEFGLWLCLLVVGLFAFVVLRGFTRILREENLFVVLAVAGLLVLFGLQAIINMGSALHLMPPKGMTLPFISYGGSSALALALAMGMVLALTRRGDTE